MAEASRFDPEAQGPVGEARYRSLVEAVASVVWTTDPEGQFVEPQPSWDAYTGQPWPDHAGFGWADMVHVDDRRRVEERWGRSVAATEPYAVDVRVWHAGTAAYRWCEIRAAPVREPGGGVVEWIGTVTDVHARRAAEARAREAAARIDTLLRAAPIGLAFFDTGLRFVMVNQTMADMDGRPVPDHIGRLVADVLPQLVDNEARPFARVLETGEPVLDLELVVDVRGAAGEQRDWLVNYFPVHDDGGTLLGVGATVVDVTERTRAEQRLAEERQVVETLHWVGTTLSGELDLGRLVQAVTDAATLLTGARFGAFFYNVVDDEGERYALYTISGVPREAFEDYPMPRNTPIFEPTFTGEQVLRLDDVTADPRYGHVGPFHGMPEGHLKVRSYLAVPVVSRSGEVLGGLFFGHEEPGMFDERDERLAVGIAAQAAIGMDNAMLYEAVRRAEHRQSVLARAGAELTTSLEPAEVLRRLAGIVVPELADVCEVDLLRPDGTLERFVHSGGAVAPEVEAAVEAAPVDLDGPHPVAQVLRTGEPLLVRDVPPELPDARRAIVVPLEARGQVIGALSLVARTADRRFADGDVEMAEDLADRAAAAIENARLYDQQRQAALTLQRSLLPATIAAPPGVAVSVRYLPGGESQVGGDWYDVVPLPSGRVAVAVGDVMGRGIPAAARMGQLRNGLRAYLLDERGPADALTRLEVFADPQRTFVTIACGVVDPAARTLTLANAGHVPPLLLVPGSAPRFLNEPLTVPVGTVIGPPVEEGVVHLPPDATVVLFTDGLVERRTEALDAGLERLRVLAGDAAGQPDLETFVDVLLAGMLGDAPTDDDVAVLALWLP